MKKKTKKKVEIYQRVSYQKIRCLIYASFMLGFLASAEDKRSLNSPKNFEEIKNVIALLK